MSDRDTASVWVGGDTGGRPGPAVRMPRAGATLLGLVVGSEALALAVGVHVEVAQRAGHDVTAERSTSVERTSLPVVVRGNASSRRSTRGRL